MPPYRIELTESAKVEPLCNQMADLDQQTEEHELKVLKDANDPAYHDAKEEVETRELRDEVDANEEESDARELQDIEAMLQNKLESLLHKES
jgi:hypothetical protein